MLVVGASKGIGKAIAISYAKAGCSNIVIVARSDLSPAIKDVLDAVQCIGRSSTPNVVPLSADITSEADVQRLASTITDKFGSIDVLINNAGTHATSLPLLAGSDIK